MPRGGGPAGSQFAVFARPGARSARGSVVWTLKVWPEPSLTVCEDAACLTGRHGALAALHHHRLPGSGPGSGDRRHLPRREQER